MKIRDSLPAAVESGDRLTALESLRNTIAVRLEQTESARDTAALSNALMRCLQEIDELRGGKPEEMDSLSQMRARFKLAK